MQNENSKFKILRKRYPKFIYQNYSFRVSKDNLEILFNFMIKPDIFFKPKIIIKNVKKSQLNRVWDKVLNNLIFHLGLMEIPTYWKAACSPEIEIQAGELTKEQIKWWKELILRGMGQFFYENKIDFTQPNFLKINSRQRSDPCKTCRGQTPVKLAGVRPLSILVPIGGGKDSVVTSELLKKMNIDIRCFSLNPTDAALKIMKIADCKKPIIVRRKIDPKLLELNRRGFLNGHTPFSAYLAFLSVLVAVIFGQKYIAFSNERSSNEGNLKYLGKTINHQWSKSFDFEKRFRDYSKRYLAPHQKNGGGIEYFSFLRPFYEIQIAKLFSKIGEWHLQYFNAFLSCNEAYKTNSGRKKTIKKWCGNCPKCLFVFAILYPFVGEKIIKIFGKNLFEDKNLLPTMWQLIEGEKFKPFECVGTKKESLIAFYLSYKNYKGQTPVKLPFLLKYFEKKILPRTVPPKAGLVRGLPKYPNLEREAKKIMNSWNEQNNLPLEFIEILKSAFKNGSQ